MDACTIISRNYIPFARTMIKSYRKYHPEGRFFVLLLDKPEGLDLSKEPWETVFAEDLGMGTELDTLRMLYSAYEMSMSLRPAFMLHLMRKKNSERLLFLDSDLYFTGRLHEADQWLNDHALSICVSIREPLPDDNCHPSDKDFILAGSLNGGFVLARRCEETERTMEWLDGKLRKEGYYRPYEGLFGDQKWLDLWVSFCDTLGVIKQKGWNVSHWNIHERPLTKKNDIIFAGDEPMAFYHFSGFRMEDENVISAHQNRYRLDDQPVLAELLQEYRSELTKNDYGSWKKIPYLYDLFENGVRISETVRRCYEETQGPRTFPKPHDVRSKNFYHWIMHPVFPGSPITNLHLSIWRMSLHAKARFPDPISKNRDDFAYWILTERKRELSLDPELTHRLSTIDLRKKKVRVSLKFLTGLRHAFWPYQKLTRAVKKIIGKKLFYRLKPRSDGVLGYPYFRLQITEKRPHGVTVISAKGAENGVGQAARDLVKALDKANIPHEHIDSRTAPGRQDIVTPLKRLFWYDTIVIAGGAQEIGDIVQCTELVIGSEQRIIAALPWESSKFPKKYASGFDLFSEVWAPSTYSADILKQYVNAPVTVMPYVVDVTGKRALDRTAFGLAKDSFLCLFVFDFYSFVERKNPEAAICAFREAFGDDPKAELLVVGSHADDFPTERNRLRKMIAGFKNVKLHETYLPRPVLLGLIGGSDCYVSLHRSEGFGLTIAEAMALAVPTVATAFGGCTDFLTVDTGFPVAFTPMTLESNVGPYEKGTVWGEANITDAAHTLKYIRGDRAKALVKAAHGSFVIREQYGTAKIGSLVSAIIDA